MLLFWIRSVQSSQGIHLLHILHTASWWLRHWWVCHRCNYCCEHNYQNSVYHDDQDGRLPHWNWRDCRNYDDNLHRYILQHRCFTFARGRRLVSGLVSRMDSVEWSIPRSHWAVVYRYRSLHGHDDGDQCCVPIYWLWYFVWYTSFVPLSWLGFLDLPLLQKGKNDKVQDYSSVR